MNYMPPIDASVNELSTVQTLLQISINATRNLEQEFTFEHLTKQLHKKPLTLRGTSEKSTKTFSFLLALFIQPCPIVLPLVNS